MGVWGYGRKALILISLPMFVLAARFLPWHKLPSMCMFYHLTGLPCPSCGMTRSVISLTHLRFREAVSLNPLGPLFVGMFVLWWALSVYQMAAGRQVCVFQWAGRHVGLLAIIGTLILFVFGGIRILWLAGR